MSIKPNIVQLQPAQHIISSFYEEFGIKQYNSFSGGFKYLDKPKKKDNPHIPKKEETDLYQEFGLRRAQGDSYKLNNDYVPDTKLELADRLVEKLEHKMHKMNYYRNKYYGNTR